MITHELQQWHKQQVSKYKNLTEEVSKITNEQISIPTVRSEETGTMIASAALPSNENSRTICSSSFIVTDESIIPKAMAQSLTITDTNDGSNHRDKSRSVI